MPTINVPMTTQDGQTVTTYETVAGIVTPAPSMSINSNNNNQQHAHEAPSAFVVSQDGMMASDQQHQVCCTHLLSPDQQQK